MTDNTSPPAGEATDARHTAGLAGDQHWHGYLTLANLEAVAARITRMLGDGQPFTVAEAYEYAGYRPQVRTSQTLRDGVTVSLSKLDDGRDFGRLNMADTSRVWGQSTTVLDQAAARAAEKTAREDLAFFVFTAQKIEVEFFTSDGLRAFRTIALETRRVSSVCESCGDAPNWPANSNPTRRRR